MKTLSYFFGALVLSIGFIGGAAQVMGGATDCSTICVVDFNTVCAENYQIYASNVLLIMAFGSFIGAFRFLYIAANPPPKIESLNLNDDEISDA